MKKILLSSIIMLGVCSAVNAQSAKGKKNDVSAASTTTAAAAPTPQKAAVMAPSDDVAAPAPKTAADKGAVPVAPVTKNSKAAQATPVPATTVNAAGVVVPTEEAKLQAVKETEAKATGANEKKNQQ